MATKTISTAGTHDLGKVTSGYTSIGIKGTNYSSNVVQFYFSSEEDGATPSISGNETFPITIDATGSVFTPVAEGLYTIGPLPPGRILCHVTTTPNSFTTKLHSISKITN